MPDANNLITGSRSTSVGVNDTLNIGGDQSTAVQRNASSTVAANQSLSIGKDLQTTVGANAGLKVAKHLVIEAGDSLTLKVGAASLTLKKDGSIVLKGRDITIDADGVVNVRGSKDVLVKGSKLLQN